MLPSAAESGIELSCRDAIRTNPMTETVPIDRPPTARATVSRRRSAKPATVSASALAQHLDCSRTYIGKLEAEGVIQRQGVGCGTWSLSARSGPQQDGKVGIRN